MLRAKRQTAERHEQAAIRDALEGGSPIPAVAEAAGVSKQTIYERVQRGTLPGRGKAA
jgi:AcrR family transcriptional regulator